MILLVEHLWEVRVHHHPVEALADFREFVGKEIRAHALVERLPDLAVVVGAEAASGGNSYEDTLRVLRVEDDGVNHQSARARLPILPRCVLGQGANLVPGLSAIIAAEKCAGIHAAPKRVRAGLAVGGNVPNAVQFQPAILTKA